MRLKINRYTSFYTLYTYLLIFKVLPNMYNGISIGEHAIVVISIYALVMLLPIIFLIILVVDIINKRYQVAIKNILMVLALYFFTWGLKTQILDVYIYKKPDTSKEIPAEPPMSKN